MERQDANSSGMLSLLELRRNLLREASALSARAEHLRHRGEPMLAGTLLRRSQRLLQAAQRISDSMSSK